MSFRRHLAFSLLAALLLTSCVPLATPVEPPFATRQEPWDCAEVIDTKLESFLFDADAEAARAWVQTQYMLNAAEVRVDLSADGTQSMLHWNQSARPTYGAAFWNDGREVARVTAYWYRPGPSPTLADVLRCLGAPPLYRAYYASTPGGPWTSLKFWYPERGIIIGTYITRRVTEITLSQPVMSVSYTRPGPLEDLVARFYWTSARGSDSHRAILESLKPWPGDITKITIDERG